jgi:uncharacterized protein YacL (UPF0231 family)
MALHLHRDSVGELRAQSSPPHELLGHFLEDDVQQSMSYCREILAAIDQVSSGEMHSWEQTGNAHTLTLYPDRAIIEAEFDDSAAPCHLSLSELRDAVRRWLEFIKA